MWVFEQPAYLLLLILVPALAYFRHFRRNRGGKITVPFEIWNSGGFSPPFLARYVVYVCAIVAYWVGVVLWIVALAGPVSVHRERVYLTPGVNIMFVLDESPTMGAEDVGPINRFESARETIRRFIARRENDPVGIVSFAREAALRAPLTLDYRTVLRALDTIQIMQLGDGTAIGMGIALATLHLDAADGGESVIILLTDGVNNAGEILPETATRVAANLGVRVYTIGIGTEGEIALEFTNPNTGQTYRGRITESFNESQLRWIAEATGGVYFHAASGGSLDAILHAIDSLETIERRSRVQVHTRPRHRILIIVGLCLIFAEFVVRKIALGEIV